MGYIEFRDRIMDYVGLRVCSCGLHYKGLGVGCFMCGVWAKEALSP